MLFNKTPRKNESKQFFVLIVTACISLFLFAITGDDKLINKQTASNKNKSTNSAHGQNLPTCASQRGGLSAGDCYSEESGNEVYRGDFNGNFRDGPIPDICEKVTGIGPGVVETFSRRHEVSSFSVYFRRTVDWGNRCELIVDTTKGIKKCVVWYIVKTKDGRIHVTGCSP